ncbi:MAG: glycosyltransferase family 2 protein [Nostoc sp.]|uniref:glycosyltransferase n=1 Tax=Nostoc sp. TaxID=1180 RepID=UPI002FF7AA31
MISIIIPTVNRFQSLQLAIESLIKQNFPVEQFEILILDNGSTDATKSVSETIIEQYPSHQIYYIYEPEPGLLSGRHRGALAAKGEILTFIDDDIEADVNWLQAIHEAFTDPTVQIVGGRNLPKYEVEPPRWLKYFWRENDNRKICAYLSLLDFGDQVQVIDANYVWGLNFSIRKKILFELGGFHPDCIPSNLQHFQGDGETGLTQKSKKLGYKAIYHPQALVFHEVSRSRMTPEYFNKRFFYQGVADSYTQIRKDGGNLVKNQVQPTVNLTFRGKLFLKTLKKQILHSINEGLEISILADRFRLAYERGYQFHQNAVRKHPELLHWVLKENYWEYKLPSISVKPPRKR